MILLNVDEAYAFDYLSILEVKKQIKEPIIILYPAIDAFAGPTSPLKDVF